jgi:aerobic C4-dicarboxylate transport protein
MRLFNVSIYFVAALGDRARPITDFLNNLTAPVFYLVGMLMKLAPIGATAPKITMTNNTAVI